MHEQKAHISKDNEKITTRGEYSSLDQRKRQSNNMDEGVDPKVMRSNRFAALECEDDCDREVLLSFAEHVSGYKNNKIDSPNEGDQNKTTKTPQIQNNNRQSNGSVPHNKENNNKKIPPINIFDTDTKQLINFLKNGLKIVDFQIKQFRSKKALYLNSLNDHIRVKTYLEKTKSNFVTFTPKSLKNKTFLLKGLEADSNPTDLLNELRIHESDDLKFIKVGQFTTKKSVSDGYKLPIFIVQISPESDINKLKSIRSVDYRIVTWEHLKRPEITQCRNCQGFNHSSSNCFLPHKCVKCNNSHEKGKCETKDVPKENLYCVLCKSFGHPASYKGCQVYKDLQQKLRNKKENIKEAQNNSHMYKNYTNQNITFSKVLRNNEHLPVNNIPTNSFLLEIKNMMSNLSSQLINMQQQLQMQSAQIETIFSMLGV